MPVLAARGILDSLDMHEEQMELDASVLEAVQRMEASAQGEAGDAKKYKAAEQSMLRRWNLFLDVHGLTHEEEPRLEMMGQFDAFMYQYRQRGSRAGKAGLGDSLAEMAQYILAQVCGTAARACGHALSQHTLPWTWVPHRERCLEHRRVARPIDTH